MPSVRASRYRTPFLIHSSTAKEKLYMGRRGQIHFRGFGMRQSYITNFCVTQVHQDHVQIIDEKKQAAWNTFCQTAGYQSTCQKLRDAAQQAQMIFDESKAVHQQSLCEQSKAKMNYAAKKLHKAQVALHNFQTPDYFCNVPYDSIFSLQFPLGDGLVIRY